MIDVNDVMFVFQMIVMAVNTIIFLVHSFSSKADLKTIKAQIASAFFVLFTAISIVAVRL